MRLSTARLLTVTDDGGLDPLLPAPAEIAVAVVLVLAVLGLGVWLVRRSRRGR
ncbi:hypothetical protein [Nocardioides sp. Leaf285]|uniref:hypothetical protein n=1 Tax=Nocardioides sp. Leaf285 TaxID=1736322 RepID=UPI000A45981B|nr:hypothetical protein [Nocardioides sp. Leaf285]